jgi:hypothetical protein
LSICQNTILVVFLHGLSVCPCFSLIGFKNKGRIPELGL